MAKGKMWKVACFVAGVAVGLALKDHISFSVGMDEGEDSKADDDAKTDETEEVDAEVEVSLDATEE